MNINRKYIIDAKGEKIAVILTMNSWRKILEKLEDFDDLKVSLRASQKKDKKFSSLKEVQERIREQKDQNVRSRTRKES